MTDNLEFGLSADSAAPADAGPWEGSILGLRGAAEKSFDAIDGVPTWYRRFPNGGQRRYTFRSTDDLYRQLVRFKRDLNAYVEPAGYGPLTRIYLGGTYVAKGGQHGLGRAVDFDRFEFASGKSCTPIARVHAHRKQWARLRYWAMVAVCRQHFRWVLDASFNAAHHDHIHGDLGGMPVRLARSSTSEAKFVQSVCREFAGTSTTVDGQWGPQTDRHVAYTLRRAGLAHLRPLNSVSDYRKFLQRISQKGFRGQTF